MEYIFTTASPEAARALGNRLDGPEGLPGIDAVPTPGIMPSPHIEQLAGFALGREVPLCTSGMVALTPDFDPDAAEQVGPTIQQLPDALRDYAADVTMRPDLADQWAEELWGHDAASAFTAGQAITELARRARAADQHLYAWWTL